MIFFGEMWSSGVRRVAILTALLCAGAAGDAFAADDRITERRLIAPDYDDLKLLAQSRQAIPVLVTIKTDSVNGGNLADRREAARQSLNTAMATSGLQPFMELRRFGVSAFRVNANQLDQLIDSGLVDSVQESKPLEPHLQQSNTLIDSQVARDYGLYGDGAVVVVLDTGIDADHPTFDDRVVWEACFSSDWPGLYNSTNLCPAGSSSDGIYFSQTGPGAAALTKCTDVPCWHGTHVASIAAGSQSTYTGMAPQADIIAIQVFSRFTSTYVCGSGQAPCVRTFEHDQLAALAYVADLAESYNIASVNMSLGGGRYYSACDSSKQSWVPVIEALKSLDIVVAASSGNNYWDDSIGHPACLSNIVSVGSVLDNSDTVSSFSNGASFLDVLAPGQGITAAYPGTGYATASGTSMAAPHVAGALALLKGYDDSLSYAGMKSLLVGNGTPVLDTRNNLTFPRLDLGLLTLAVAGGPAGDADHDGDVDIADLVLVQRHLTGVITLGADAIRRCDLHPAGNPNGLLHTSDLILLEQLVLTP